MKEKSLDSSLKEIMLGTSESTLTYKAINFDLNTKALKQYYQEKDYRKAYKDIKKYLCSNGFKHRQWSGYLSTEKMNDADIFCIVEDMSEKFPWLANCTRTFDVTDVGKIHDLRGIILNAATPKPSKEKQFIQSDKCVFYDKNATKEDETKQTAATLYPA